MQTFLVGQPEFRSILQGPGMLQLRQRVTARCHLGPLDEEDTRSYIEHRLKCAGAVDKPVFEPAVFAAIFQHSGGIPRRINTLCDRLLLQGYLSEAPKLTLDALNEVVAEMNAESAVPTPGPEETEDRWAHLPKAGEGVEPRPSLVDGIGPEDLDLDPALVDGIGEELTRVSAEQLSTRLLRMERSVLRQERVSLEILGALKKIVAATRKSRNNGASN